VLGLYELTEDAQNGMTLAEQVETTRRYIAEEAPEALPRFDDLLMQAGYIDAQAELYTVRHALRSTRFFRVEDDFPRLTPSNVRPGVVDVTYVIDLALAGPFEVPEDDLVVRFADRE
jgi:hypothetical protein